MWQQNALRSAAAALSMMAVLAHAADKMGKTEKTEKAGQAQLAKDDRNFMLDAAQGGMKEGNMGKLAQEKGQSEGVKQFGKRLEDDHSKANEQLKDVAQKVGVKLPDALDKKHQATVDKFAKRKPAEFDRQFAKHMVDDHEKDIKKFRKEADKGRNAEVKQLASQTLPTLEEHLKIARDLTGGSAGKAGSKGSR